MSFLAIATTVPQDCSHPIGISFCCCELVCLEVPLPKCTKITCDDKVCHLLHANALGFWLSF